MTHQKTVMHFHFADQEGKIQPLYFSDPVRILAAWTIADIIPCLEAVEQAVNDGNYAAGYLSYEAAPAFDKDFQVNTGTQMPLLWFGIFPDSASMPADKGTGHFEASPWVPATPANDYYVDIEQILSKIERGKTDQVNYTLRLESTFQGNTYALYNQLRQAQEAKYTAYADIGDFTIVSASPELFFHLDQQEITVRPMKGTIKRGKTYQDDQKNKATLHQSKKDRTENQLVVSLMKKELEKLTSPDKINVVSQFDIEQYPTVYQMTSTIKAGISSEKTITDIFQALFPCGSITGAPKKETMETIAALEETPREVYCGAMGYITPGKQAIFNVPIRTVIIENESGLAAYGAGGGITGLSKKEDEYNEALAKAEVLTAKRPSFNLLETIGLFDGAYFLFEKHMDRIVQSAAYFNYTVNRQEIEAALHQEALNHPHGSFKVRVLAEKNGHFTIETGLLHTPLSGITARLAKEPVNKDDVFFYHKTSNRQAFELLKQACPDVSDVLLFNDNLEITEFTTGNIVVEYESGLYTPPVSCGLLAGTFREKLLCDGVIQEKILKTDILSKCTKIWYVNSVRGWVPVQFKR